MKKTAAVILAAGASTRFGSPKQLIDWQGTPLLAHIADQALGAGLDPVIVVLGSSAQEARTALGGRDAQPVMNWRWEEGLSTSVKTGLAALPPDVEAVILMQCDQPLLTADLLRSLVARFEETSAPIVYPVHAGRRGTPTLFARCLFPELAAVNGDVGGRPVIARHAGEVATVEVAQANVLADIDTPADRERLMADVRTPKPDLASIAHLIIDMDGVLWRGDEPMPGLGAFFGCLRRRGIDFVLATNNASSTPEQYTTKLARFGVDVGPEHILTSALVAAAYLADVAPSGGRVFAVGEDGVKRALEEQGFVLLDETACEANDYKGIDYVVVGWDRFLTWDKLATASLAIDRGAGFVGTNPDLNFPNERGPVPGNGAQLVAIEVTTGVSPIVTGKPELPMYQKAMRRMGAHPETTAMIGDRLDTDIAGGVRAGLTTILVLSGINGEADLARSAIRPDVVCADIRAVTEMWNCKTDT